IVSDDIGSALVGGTTVSLTATNVTVFPSSFSIPDSNVNTTGGPVPGLTEFTVVLANNTQPTPVPAPSASPGPPSIPQQASLTVTVDSPITTGTSDVRCPGANGSAF